MEHQIHFEPPKIQPSLKRKDRLLFIGSCFSEHFAERLVEYKFEVYKHPFGTLYHPLPIINALSPNRQKISSQDIINNGDVHLHWDTHSNLWAKSKEELISTYQTYCDEITYQVENVDWLIITLGSSFLYRIQQNNRPVANCHKQPGSLFIKELTKASAQIDLFEGLLLRLKEINPEVQILLTVSPVRHVKDGLIENNVSKSQLLSAVYDLTQKFDNTHYFPSYEIMIDQLRDHRYYKEDMIHPSEQAVDFIWDQLVLSWFDEECQIFIKKWTGVIQAMKHSVLYPNTESHRAFIKMMIQKLDSFVGIDTSRELAYFKDQLVNESS